MQRFVFSPAGAASGRRKNKWFLGVPGVLAVRSFLEDMTESDQPGQERQGDPNREYRVVAGRRILFDGEGFLWNPEDWSEEVAVFLARECGLVEMAESHWRVIRFLRDYYHHHGRAPLNSHLKSGTGMSLVDLEGLFPCGIKRGARRIAGLPNPKSCTG